MPSEYNTSKMYQMNQRCLGFINERKYTRIKRNERAEMKLL